MEISSKSDSPRRRPYLSGLPPPFKCEYATLDADLALETGDLDVSSPPFVVPGTPVYAEKLLRRVKAEIAQIELRLHRISRSSDESTTESTIFCVGDGVYQAVKGVNALTQPSEFRKRLLEVVKKARRRLLGAVLSATEHDIASVSFDSQQPTTDESSFFGVFRLIDRTMAMHRAFENLTKEMALPRRSLRMMMEQVLSILRSLSTQAITPDGSTSTTTPRPKHIFDADQWEVLDDLEKIDRVRAGITEMEQILSSNQTKREEETHRWEILLEAANASLEEASDKVIKNRDNDRRSRANIAKRCHEWEQEVECLREDVKTKNDIIVEVEQKMMYLRRDIVELRSQIRVEKENSQNWSSIRNEYVAREKQLMSELTAAKTLLKQRDTHTALDGEDAWSETLDRTNNPVVEDTNMALDNQPPRKSANAVAEDDDTGKDQDLQPCTVSAEHPHIHGFQINSLEGSVKASKTSALSEIVHKKDLERQLRKKDEEIASLKRSFHRLGASGDHGEALQIMKEVFASEMESMKNMFMKKQTEAQQRMRDMKRRHKQEISKLSTPNLTVENK